VRNLGAKDYADIALRDAINDGDVIGPRMVASGPALGITGGHCDENLLPPAFHFQGEGVADGVEGVQHRVREVIKYGADVIKICATGGVLSKGDDPNASQYTLEEMKAIVTDAHRLGRRVAAHAHGAEGVRWLGGRRRFDRARPPDGRRGHRHAEEKRNISRADALPRRIHGKEHGPQRYPEFRSKRCEM